jgi:hypothetical protein
MTVTVEYGARDFDNQAWSAIDRGEAVDIVVRGWRAPIVRRSLPLCEAFFGRERSSGRHSLRNIVRLGLYGWFSPWLLGTYNHAVLAGMSAHWRETDGAIVVSFKPSTPERATDPAV